MKREPAAIIGAISAILIAVIAWVTELNDLLIAIVPVLQAIATRQSVYAPATFDAAVSRAHRLEGGE